MDSNGQICMKFNLVAPFLALRNDIFLQNSNNFKKCVKLVDLHLGKSLSLKNVNFLAIRVIFLSKV